MSASTTLLLPQPRKFHSKPGVFRGDWRQATVRIDTSIARRQGYVVEIAPDAVSVVAHDQAGAFYARQTLAQLAQIHRDVLPCCTIEDWPDFLSRGVMLDVSRDKVPTLATLRSLIDRLASWKINQLQLYLEHTFAYRDHRTVWEHASPFTADEIRELDVYCSERFIELVPNQNSFGHMERWLKHPRYLPLAEAPDGAQTPWGFFWEGPFSLCPTDPACVGFLAELYDELLPNFTSKLFNVGCDETFDIGAGRSAAAVAERGVHAVYLEFLRQVNSLVSARGRRMMFWGDIIRKEPELIASLTDQLPGAIAMIWDYEAETQFDHDGAMFSAAGVPFYVCPGTSSWCSITGRTDVMLANARSAAVDGLRHGAIGYLMTDWGDYGHLQYLPVSDAGFVAAAAFSWCVESNDPLPLAELLDRFAFEDKAGQFGKTAVALGNLYQTTGKVVLNASSLFRILVPPKSGAIPAAGMTRVGLDAAEQALMDAMVGIGRSQLQRPDGQLIIDEFRNAGAMTQLAINLGRAQLGETSVDHDRHAWVVSEHRRLWLQRNRPGGLEDSLARLTGAVQ